MPRPPRLQFPGALYHLTARGNHQQEIYRDDVSRRAWLGMLRDVCARHDCSVHAYCQMTNHFHLMLETRAANLSRVMHWLNGSYSQWFNSRYQTVGHLFEGRFKSILVQKESYLLELVRYIMLNPVRARMVDRPGDWAWSSYHWMVGRAQPPVWLDCKNLLTMFGNRPSRAKSAFAEFVSAGVGDASPLLQVRNQILGDEDFLRRYDSCDEFFFNASNVAVPPREAPLSLEAYQSNCRTRDEAMVKAFLSTTFTMRQIARHFSVSPQTVGRVVRRYEIDTLPQ